MKKCKIILLVSILSVFLTGVSGMAAGADLNGDIKFLMNYTVEHGILHEGPGGGAMWFIGKQEIPRGGTRNIFFRVHDGGNRPYITVMNVTITPLPDGKRLVRSVIITDGGCDLRDNDSFGPVDGRPDSVCENDFTLGADNEALKIKWGSERRLRAGSAEYGKINSLFVECIKEVGSRGHE